MLRRRVRVRYFTSKPTGTPHAPPENEVKADPLCTEKVSRAVKSGIPTVPLLLTQTVKSSILLRELVQSKQAPDFDRFFAKKQEPRPFDYPINETSARELESVITGQLANHDVKLPSSDLGIVTVSVPFEGAELMLQNMAETIAQRHNFKFVCLDNESLFPRLAGPEVANSPPIQAVAQPDQPTRSGRRRNLAPGTLQFLSISTEITRDESEGSRTTDDVPFAPYPWFKGYTHPTQETPAFLTSRLKEPMPFIAERSRILYSTFLKLFDAMTFTEPTVLFYTDFMRLLNVQDSSATREVVRLFSNALQKRRRKYPTIVVIPYTSTFKVVDKNKTRGLSGILGSGSNGSAEDGTDPDKDVPTVPVSLLSPAAAKPEDPYVSPLDSILGIVNVPVYPPMEPKKLAAFKARMALDLQKMCRHENFREIELSARATDISLQVCESEWNDILDTLQVQGSRTSLDTSFIYAKDAERILLLALGSGSLKPGNSAGNQSPDLAEPKRVINKQSLEFACKTFTASAFYHEAMGTDSSFAYAFKQDFSLLKTLNSHEKRMLKSCLVQPDHVSTTFKSIGGLDDTKRVINELIRLPLQRPELFRTGILKQSITGILLFGPPGTGKTMMARAVAAESGANFLNVQMSHLSSMWVGENEKNVRALFSLARKLKPTVVFIDEIDSLLRARHATNPAYVTNTINEFMQEWDGVNSEGGVIVIGATNRPFDLDDAVLRRLPRRLMVNLPDEKERFQILSVLLSEELVQPGAIEKISKETSFFSGSDLKNLCIAAALNSLREQQAATNKRTLEYRHFRQAIDSGDVVPSISEKAQLLKQLKEWDGVYGKGYGKTVASWGF